MMTRKFVAMLMMSIAMILFNQLIFGQDRADEDAQTMQINQDRLSFFEKISKQYYGTKGFGPELELVNRFVQVTPSTSHANLIIPSYEAMLSFKYQGSEQIVVGNDEIGMSSALRRFGGTPIKFDKTSDMTAWHPSATLFGLAVIASLLSIAFSIITYFHYRQKAKALALAGLSGDESIKIDKSRLIDYDPRQGTEAPIPANLAVLQGAN